MNNNSTNDAQKSSVLEILARSIPKDRAAMKSELREAVRAYAEALQAKAGAGKLLVQKRLQYLHPKDKDLTDMDRKIMLEAHVSEYQADYDSWSGIAESLEKRINAILFLLQ